MYNVSQRYRDGMKRDLRERSYIRVNFGIVNQEAQSSAVVDWANTSMAETYSDSSSIFNNGNDDVDYATFERDFVKVDGSQVFYNDTANLSKYVSTDFVTEQNPVTVTINLNVENPQEIKGLTVSFGDLYPVKFNVIDVTTGKTITSVTDNTSATWISEEVLSDIKSVRFVFYKMKSSPARLRINYILFGLGKTYTNDNIVESTLEESISPINENLPQYDFSVQLDNYPDENGVRYFDVDNPSSTINYLKKGQEIDVYYGYELPTNSEEDEDAVEDLSEDSSGEIEWVKGGHFYLSEWESNDTTATIKATDILRNKEDTYDKGVYSSSGTTYYDLCVSVLADMGITNYQLSGLLKSFKTTTPVPKVTHKEVLQLIANACGCVISVDRDGKVIIGLSPGDKNAYMELSTKNVTKSESGYVSSETSNTSGVFSNPPEFHYDFYERINVNKNLIGYYYGASVVNGVELQFGEVLPSEIRITNGASLNLVVRENIQTDMNIPLGFVNRELSNLTITFPKTKNGNEKVSIKKIKPVSTTGFEMDKTDISENITVTKLNTLKQVTVSFGKYATSSTAEEVVTEDIVDLGTTWKTETFTFDEPYSSFYAEVTRHVSSGEEETDEKLIGHTKILKQGAYYVEVSYTQNYDGYGYDGDTLRVYGYKLNKTDFTHTINYNDTGDVISWENPLIDNREQARIMATLIGNHYSDDMEYSYSTRGNPELDVNDIIYQENDYHDNMSVRLINHTIGFNGSFSGSVTARREV